jgi:hypothetical protein
MQLEMLLISVMHKKLHAEENENRAIFFHLLLKLVFNPYIKSIKSLKTWIGV